MYVVLSPRFNHITVDERAMTMVVAGEVDVVRALKCIIIIDDVNILSSTKAEATFQRPQVPRATNALYCSTALGVL